MVLCSFDLRSHLMILLSLHNIIFVLLLFFCSFFHKIIFHQSFNIFNVLCLVLNRNLHLSIPKFTISSSYDLKDIMEKLGVTDIFNNDADLSGINGERNLKVSKVSTGLGMRTTWGFSFTQICHSVSSRIIRRFISAGVSNI